MSVYERIVWIYEVYVRESRGMLNWGKLVLSCKVNSFIVIFFRKLWKKIFFFVWLYMLKVWSLNMSDVLFIYNLVIEFRWFDNFGNVNWFYLINI